MVPITTFKSGQIIDMGSEQLYPSIIEICKEHKEQNRALAFAFILYNHKNPQVIKTLRDKDYWASLNETSGKFLSVFYIIQPDAFFAQDLSENDGIEKRGLFGINTTDGIKPILKNFLHLDQKLNLPAVLFFQVTENLVSDYFIVSLDEKKVEDSFWELQTYIQKAVDKIDTVNFDINHNSSEIFNLLKSGVSTEKVKRQLFKITQKFPIQLLLSWLTSKI